ncbi:hypothetical protein F4823DRAFT_592131 [Ustulina deusta]|nr:hypothetical protein F4823DRAFT_592131 [Ustulina deusta]
MSSQLSHGVVSAPPGVVPNFVSPPNDDNQIIIVHTIFLIITTLSVVMRIYTQLQISSLRLGVSDYLCVISYAGVVAFSGVLFKSMSWGLGRHIWDVPLEWLENALKWETIASWIYFVTATYIKLGFLFFYRRIFSPDATAKVLVNGGIVVSSLVGLGLFIGIVFFCLPIGKAWNNALSGHCANPVVLAWLSGAWNALVDIYVLILPIPFIWKLNMAPKRKRRLIAVFGVGIFACVASLVRLGKTPILQSSCDATYNLSQVSLWATLEINVGLTCSCLLVLPAFLCYHLPASAKSSTNTSEMELV